MTPTARPHTRDGAPKIKTSGGLSRGEEPLSRAVDSLSEFLFFSRPESCGWGPPLGRFRSRLRQVCSGRTNRAVGIPPIIRSLGCGQPVSSHRAPPPGGPLPRRGVSGENLRSSQANPSSPANISPLFSVSGSRKRSAISIPRGGISADPPEVSYPGLSLSPPGSAPTISRDDTLVAADPLRGRGRRTDPPRVNILLPRNPHQ